MESNIKIWFDLSYKIVNRKDDRTIEAKSGTDALLLGFLSLFLVFDIFCMRGGVGGEGATLMVIPGGPDWGGEYGTWMYGDTVPSVGELRGWFM